MLDLSDSRPLRDLRFAVLDLETTGGNPQPQWRDEQFFAASEITEVGVVRLSGALQQGSFESLCRVEGSIPSSIQRLTGITPPMLASAPSWERVALRLAEELEGRLWVAHHAPFDGAFLKAYLPEGLWKRHTLLCTRKLAKALVPEAPRASLAALCETLDLHNRRPHRALPDAEATADLLACLLERAEAKGLESDAFQALGRVDWKKL
ncbi:MAG: 3'-5' exonuclease [Firmicutes bacterium]|nr:3'-5' exonuclease [Bacillota bacterium]